MTRMKAKCVWPALAFMRTRTRGSTLDIFVSPSSFYDFSIADLKLRRQPNELACIVRAQKTSPHSASPPLARSLGRSLSGNLEGKRGSAKKKGGGSPVK